MSKLPKSPSPRSRGASEPEVQSKPRSALLPVVGLVTALTGTTEPVTVTLCAVGLLAAWRWLR